MLDAREEATKSLRIFEGQRISPVSARLQGEDMSDRVRKKRDETHW